ncbi:DNA-directed RNA polymerase III subunit RPC3 [Podochytrium sp. JEL0797]|nr:DNA-directed RNA polymerase III subunit RPC3 [Podochytrium sp. JEL0797]
MTTHETQVIGLIVNEHFGESAQIAVLTLLGKGRLTLPQLIAHSELTPRAVRSALFVLIQHNIVSFTEASEGLAIRVYYSVNKMQVLLRDRFALYLQLAQERFGVHGRALTAEILRQGKCTFAHISDSLYPDPNAVPVDTLDAFEDAFNNMIEQNFVVRVADDDSANAVDRKVADEESEIAKNPNMSAAEKKKMRANLESRTQGVEFLDMPVGQKRKLVYQFDEGAAKAAKVLDDEEENMAEKAFWRLNPSRFHIATRNKAITALVETRINKSAKEIMKLILEYAEPSMKHCKADETSAAITLTHLASRMDTSVLTFNPTTSRAAITDYLTLLTMDQEFPFLTKQDDRGGGQYVSNLFDLRTSLHESLILATVKEKFGIVAARVWRLLKTKGMLGEKEVAKLALVSNKVARETLYQLNACGMIFLQDVPRALDHAPSRTFYVWYVSLPKCVENLIQETYQMIANLKIRRTKEYAAAGQLIEKIEREDIKADADLLTEGEKQSVEKFNTMMGKLRVSELRLDQALQILRDY